MDNNVEGILARYLAESSPSRLPADEAMRLLRHATECGECDRKLLEHELHAATLLDCAKPPGKQTAETLSLLNQAQTQLVVAGDALLHHLEEGVIAQLADPVAPEMAMRFAANGESDLSPTRMRAASAVSSTKLALETLVSRRRGDPDTARLDSQASTINIPGEEVDADFFAREIRTRTAVAPECAVALWDGICAMLRGGDVPIPGISTHALEDGSIELSRILPSREPDKVNEMEDVLPLRSTKGSGGVSGRATNVEAAPLTAQEAPTQTKDGRLWYAGGLAVAAILVAVVGLRLFMNKAEITEQEEGSRVWSMSGVIEPKKALQPYSAVACEGLHTELKSRLEECFPDGAFADRREDLKHSVRYRFVVPNGRGRWTFRRVVDVDSSSCSWSGTLRLAGEVTKGQRTSWKSCVSKTLGFRSRAWTQTSRQVKAAKARP